jgi:biopolymer transport protein ExbD
LKAEKEKQFIKPPVPLKRELRFKQNNIIVIRTKVISLLIILFPFTSCINFSTPDPVVIKAPTTVTTTTLGDYPAFMVAIKNDSSVWYKVMSSYDDTVMEKVNEPIKENLKKVIAIYKETTFKENKKSTYLIKGDNSIKYTAFKEILAAFKENEVYKFQMITISEPYTEAPKEENESLNLYVPKEEDELNSQYDSIETKLTIILLKNNGIYAYKGNNVSNGKNYNYKTIRPVIVNESKKFEDKFVVAIKPTQAASYKNSVDIIDEMTINKINKYAMLSITKKEKEFLKIAE